MTLTTALLGICLHSFFCHQQTGWAEL